ncbi:MAG: metalloregulator ArsR/SmtB family transcription factor [Buchananella hordeovulneris]|nr:metalloregulator ArsR/SmtB family transcription factor [Buchananella hordeovulneris]
MQSYAPEVVSHAANAFKVLGNPSRLGLLLHLQDHECTVSHLVELSGLSQPLVSQHLRSLRSAGLVDVRREGKEAHYRVVDQHVMHVVSDAVAHAAESL